MPSVCRTLANADIPSYEAFLEYHLPLLKGIVNKHHRRLSSSYSDSYYDDIYQEALIAMWNIHKKIYLLGEFEQYGEYGPGLEIRIISKRLNWTLSSYVARLRGGSVHEKNHLFRVYNMALHFDAFNSMTDEEIKSRFCKGSDLTLFRLKQMAIFRNVHSLEEPVSDDTAFGDTVEDYLHFNIERILSHIIEDDFLSLLEKNQRDICELLTAGFAIEEIAEALALNPRDCSDKILHIYKFAAYYGFSRVLKKIYAAQPAKPIIKSALEFEKWLATDDKLRFFYEKLTDNQKYVYLHSFILGERNKDMPIVSVHHVKAAIIKKAVDYNTDIKYYTELCLREKPSYEKLPFIDPRDKEAVFRIRSSLYESIGDRSYNMELFLFSAPAFYILTLYYFLNSDFSFESAGVFGGYLRQHKNNLCLFSETFGITVDKNDREIINKLKGYSEEEIKEQLILSRLKGKKIAIEIYSDYVVGGKAFASDLFRDDGSIVLQRLNNALKNKSSNVWYVKCALQSIKYYLYYFDIEPPPFLDKVKDIEALSFDDTFKMAAIDRNWEVLNHWLPDAIRSDKLRETTESNL